MCVHGASELVMVHANALELHALTIEGKPRIGVEVEETVPEVNVIRVDDTIFLLDLGANGIQVRIIQGPELGAAVVMASCSTVALAPAAMLVAALSTRAIAAQECHHGGSPSARP